MIIINKYKYIFNWLKLILYILLCCAIFGGSSIIGEYKMFFIIGTYIVLVLSQISNGKINVNFDNLLSKSCIALCVYIFLSLIYTFDFSSTLNYVVIFCIFTGIILINVKDLKTYDDIVETFLNISTLIALTILISCIYNNFIPTFLKFLMPRRQESLNVFYSEMKQGIFSGISFERAYAAYNLNIGLGVIISKYISKNRLKNFDIIKLIILLLALFCTGKRMLFLVPIAAFFIMSIFNFNKKIVKTMFKIIPIVIALIIAIYTFFPQAAKVFERFSDSGKSDTMEIRNERFWKYALTMFKERTFFGYGMGTFKTYLEQYRSDSIYYAHNIYIQALGELGIVGFTLLMLSFSTAIFINIKNINYYYKTKQKSKLYLSNYAFFIQILFLLYGLSGNTLYYYNQLITYAIGLNINLCLYNKMKENIIKEQINEKDRDYNIS